MTVRGRANTDAGGDPLAVAAGVGPRPGGGYAAAAIAIISGLLGQFPLVLLGLPMRLWIGLGRKTRA